MPDKFTVDRHPDGSLNANYLHRGGGGESYIMFRLHVDGQIGCRGLPPQIIMCRTLGGLTLTDKDLPAWTMAARGTVESFRQFMAERLQAESLRDFLESVPEEGIAVSTGRHVESFSDE